MKAEELAIIKERAGKYKMDMSATLSNEYRIAKVDVPNLVAEVERLQKALQETAKLPLSEDYSDAYYNEQYNEIVKRARESLK